jgi:tryptophan synthase alpha chain
MHALAGAGADVIELGVPFSDPMADGPVIQRSGERALKHHVGLDQVLGFVAEFRRTNAATPVVLMGYANPIEAMGLTPFVDGAQQAGVDGVLAVDYPPEESRDLAGMPRLASGYVYYVSLRGVTGAKHLDMKDVSAKLTVIRGKTRLPIGVGFGIRDGETARAVAQVADAVVIGSRIIQEMEQATPETCVEKSAAFLREIRGAMDA